MKISSISPLCFGCEPLGGQDWGVVSVDQIQYSIDKAIDLGLNFFDTAAVYGLGLSEERLAFILGKRRKHLFIATKGGLSWPMDYKKDERVRIVRDSSSATITQHVKDSLLRLGLECLPLFYIHWPDASVPFEETFSTLRQLQCDGLIRHIGCSNFSSLQLRDAMKYAPISFVQIPLNILDGSIQSSSDIFQVCRDSDIKIVAYNVLCNGLLTGKFNKFSSFPCTDRRSRLPIFQGEAFAASLARVDVLRNTAAASGKSLIQYAIGSVLYNENADFVITGIKKPSQLVENWSAAFRLNNP
ncbi:aldo/keto reductase family protein [Synechococcus sp. BOUM118]|nr:aldo/keto reductase family protein [Synechococcus sp. BOUM118]